MPLESGRVVIERVSPEIDSGLFPVKRVVGERVVVEADIYAEGHDLLSCVLAYRREDASTWNEAPMAHVDNDRWRGSFIVDATGRHCYTIHAWVDRFRTWAHALARRVEAAQDVTVDLLIGAELVEAAAARARGRPATSLRKHAAALRAGDTDAAVSSELEVLMAAVAERVAPTRYERELMVTVDRERARYSSWYELFPRSTAPRPGVHGTFADTARLLPDIARLGFDVLYLPPIHPIGRSFRKGRNNTLEPTAGDPGSPWAIGSEEGGHDAVHPELGTVDDFRALVRAASENGIEIALDLAFQCSPDHPYVREHPDWFRKRPDGTIQYAENPPKKYQDIYPFDFETPAWRELWAELLRVTLHWVDHGVRIFRVDNPHTKPFAFWEWLIAEVKRRESDVLFLSEAFTRPKVMYRLAKVGFTQSYTYFAWRNERRELIDYFTELARPPVSDFFRPNVWPNTQDILTEYLQTGGRAAFAVRAVLAGTLSATYGIFGPSFELCENTPLIQGKEEYLDSEKYEIRHWDRERAGNIRPLITRVNQIRRAQRALQTNDTLAFHPTDNEQLITYSKTAEGRDPILVVVNLDPRWAHSGWVTLDLEALGLDDADSYTALDLLDGAKYTWRGARNFVLLDPTVRPAHVFRILPL